MHVFIWPDNFFIVLNCIFSMCALQAVCKRTLRTIDRKYTCSNAKDFQGQSLYTKIHSKTPTDCRWVGRLLTGLADVQRQKPRLRMSLRELSPHELHKNVYMITSNKILTVESDTLFGP